MSKLNSKFKTRRAYVWKTHENIMEYQIHFLPLFGPLTSLQEMQAEYIFNRLLHMNDTSSRIFFCVHVILVTTESNIFNCK